MERFSILMYHMVTQPGSRAEAKYACPPGRFAGHMQALVAHGFNPVSLARVEEHLAGGGALPPRAVAVTLDDGFADNHDHALGALQRHRIPATVFLAAGHVGGTNAWMTGGSFPRRPMLSWDQVRAMRAAGVHFGAHTLSHPRLDRLDADAARREIAGSRERIETELGEPVRWFAYPYGLYGPHTPALVREAGFTLACSTRPGFNRRDVDPYLLRRIEVYGTDPTWKLLQKLRFGCNEAGLTQPLRYYLGRLQARFA